MVDNILLVYCLCGLYYDYAISFNGQHDNRISSNIIVKLVTSFGLFGVCYCVTCAVKIAYHEIKSVDKSVAPNRKKQGRK